MFDTVFALRDNPNRANRDGTCKVRGDLINHQPMIVVFVLALATAVPAAPPVDYGREVKPILSARCTSCHGAIRQKAGLRLDTAEFARRGGESGPAVEPGNSQASLLIDRV